MVVSLGMLAAMEDPGFFIQECNRVLKTSGELILSTQFRKRFSVMNALRRRAAGGDRKALVARGYTERGLFGLLKTGFDVMSVAHSSRFFVELVRLREYKFMRAGADDETICLDVGWRYWLAEQLDFFNFWSKGFVITVYARRRQWRERTAPGVFAVRPRVIKHKGAPLRTTLAPIWMILVGALLGAAGIA